MAKMTQMAETAEMAVQQPPPWCVAGQRRRQFFHRIGGDLKWLAAHRIQTGSCFAIGVEAPADKSGSAMLAAGFGKLLNENDIGHHG
jgi:hypothetical protein